VKDLTNYMATLQAEIETVVRAKEKLGSSYEQSLHKGATHFNEETRQLADNPLIKEISLIVAQKLQRQSLQDPELREILAGKLEHPPSQTMA